MRHSPLFIGLTREVTFAGLPLMYLIVLSGLVIIGFVITKSFTYAFISSGVGYVALRGLAAYDPKIIGVVIATLQSTRMRIELFTGKGIFYRA